MDSARLEGLATETLIALQSAIKGILATRLDTTLRVGRVASFEHPMGVHRKMVITKINTKTVSGEETHDSVKPGGKWRCSPSSLRIDPIVRSKPLPPPPRAPHTPAPASVAHELW